MDYRTRLSKLMIGTDFSFDMDCNDPARFVRMGNRIVAQWDLLTGEKQERISDLMCLLLANALQPLAKSRYGDISAESIRRVLMDEFQKPRVKMAMGKAVRLAKESVVALELEDYQRDVIYQYFDLIPQNFIENIVEGVAQYRLLPVGEVPQIAAILSEMYKEANDAHHSRHN